MTGKKLVTIWAKYISESRRSYGVILEKVQLMGFGLRQPFEGRSTESAKNYCHQEKMQKMSHF